jgi:hypothetical protein
MTSDDPSLRRAAPLDFGPLDDAETAAAADQLFANLDAKENDAPSRSADPTFVLMPLLLD